MSGIEIQQQQIGSEDTNFILRRAVPFLPKPPVRREPQESAKHEDYERSSTLEDRSRCGGQIMNDSRDLKGRTRSNDPGKIRKDVGHKTVIYFGDSNPRQREDRTRQPPPLLEACVRATSRFKENREMSVQIRDDEMETFHDSTWNDDNDNGELRDLIENGDSKTVHEIVVNISPSREDVLRIEEDESQLEDYWSLPGDTSGFKADWSFVQQWRLRG
jgi:hypothetical protein